MAIIRCPGCRERVSNQRQVCPHCGAALTQDADGTEAAQVQTRVRRRKQYRAAQLGHLSMLVTVLGAIWIWLDSGGFEARASVYSVGFTVAGAIGYLVARGRMIWLKHWG